MRDDRNRKREKRKSLDIAAHLRACTETHTHTRILMSKNDQKICKLFISYQYKLVSDQTSITVMARKKLTKDVADRAQVIRYHCDLS